MSGGVDNFWGMANTSSRSDDAGVLGSFDHVDPAALVIGANVRDELDLEEDFVDSVRQHGVLAPVTVVRDGDARLLVRDGQRRTLAARAAGLELIPVYVIPTGTDDSVRGEVERVVQQIVANDQHVALSDAQRARGIQQVLDAGVPVAKTARLLSKPRAVIAAAAEAGKSDAAMAALSSGQLTLEQAAAVAEFADDDAAVAELIAAPAGRFEHLLAQLRRARETERVLAAAADDYRGRGFEVLDTAPRSTDPACVPLYSLRDAAGRTPGDEVVTDPRYWVVLLEEEEQYFDASGEPVDEEDIDHTTRWDHHAAAAEGMRHYSSVTAAWVAAPTWYCTDYQAVGLTPSWPRQTPPPAPLPDAAGEAPEAAGDPVEADIDAGDDGDDEADSDDDQTPLVESRRTTMALNRLGEAAAEVRRRWISTHLLSGKKPPKGAAVFCASMLVAESGLLGDYRAADVAAELLSRRGGPRVVLREHAAGLAGDDGRAQLLTLALVLGALENRYTKDYWRHGQAWSTTVGPRELLTYLRSVGYTLSDIELAVLGEKNLTSVFNASVRKEPVPR